MKISGMTLSALALLTCALTFEAHGALHRIPFPEVTPLADSEMTAGTPGSTPVVSVVADSKTVDNPGHAIANETTSDASPEATHGLSGPTSGFAVRLVPARSHSSFKTVFSVEPIDYTVQVSSFKDEDQAKAKVRELKQAQVEELWIMNAKVNGEKWFRVCAGHFKSKNDAAAAQGKIAEKSGIKQAFVQKVVPRLTASNSNAS